MMKTPKLRFKEFSGEWESKKLGTICDVTMGQSPSSSCYNEENIGLPLVQGNADVKNRKTAPRIYTSEITKTCDIGDIIMSVRAPVGAISKSIHNACIGRGVCSIKPKQINEFIYQFLVKYEDKWSSISQGSTFESVNRTDITETKVSIPSKEEQEKIASFFYLIDDKISLQGEKLKMLKDYKSGMMQKIFSRELRFKDDDGRDYPEWKTHLLGKSIILYDNLRKPVKEQERSSGKYAYYGATGIIDYINDYIFDGEYLLLGEDGANIVTRNAPLIYKTNGKFWVNNHAHIFKPTSEFNIDFMKQCLERINYVPYNTGTAQPKLNAESIKSIPFKAPILEEQRKIAKLLINIDIKVQKEEEKLYSLNEYKKGLLHKMFV